MQQVPSVAAFPAAPAELTKKPLPFEQIPDGTSLEDALQATVLNMDTAKKTEAQLNALIDFENKAKTEHDKEVKAEEK